MKLKGKCALQKIKRTIREGFKYPSHGVCPLRERFFPKVSAKKLTEKGGTPRPPLRTVRCQNRKNFCRKQRFFAQKHCFFWSIL